MKVTNKKENEKDKEKTKRLGEESLYLKLELEYSKKLKALFNQEEMCKEFCVNDI